jgi:hypothetical protein
LLVDYQDQKNQENMSHTPNMQGFN